MGPPRIHSRMPAGETGGGATKNRPILTKINAESNDPY
jgi:hypothetical protein